ncbi:MAG: ACT domain-containing protein [Calditerrivibrio sp.]|nr:ACT domain-containing protein [Calditerrivibrio sp.]MCA1932694.1 ACT domain-containing protein [Calditerrivibrio sp.]MCA1980748.1 ACT domain-containing protein [Calditerrivibrio sp.]
MDRNFFAVTFVAEDRPGIVAEVTKILFDNGFNIEDSSSTLLRGIFSMILIISRKEDCNTDFIEDIFSSLKYMTTSVKRVERDFTPFNGDSYSISVYGADKAGIVYKVSKFFADKGINILDLQTKVAGKEGKPIYIMVMEVAVPEDVRSGWLDELKLLSREVGVDINAKSIETFEF